MIAMDHHRSQSNTKVPPKSLKFRVSYLWRVLPLFLFACAGLALLGTTTSLNKIQRENRQPGTTAWQLNNPADNRQIEGYASLTSVPLGGNIDLFVNTQDTSYMLT